MCFSAATSFTLAGVLGGAGTASIALNRSRSYRLVAAIPMIFAVQQASEGVIWLTIGDPAHALLQHLAVTAFVAVAVVIWPIWCPVSLWLAERDPGRRRVLAVLSGIGVVGAACALFLLLRWHPVAAVAGHSIRYDHARSHEAWIGRVNLLIYLIPTVVPFFVSTMRLARTIGVAFVASLALTFVIERDTLTSVWCFFAAILSGLVLVAVRQAPRDDISAAPAAIATPR